MRDIGHPELHQIARTELGINRYVEQGKVTDLVTQLQPDPEGLSIFQLELGLLPDQLPLVPRLVAVRCTEIYHAQLRLKGLDGVPYAESKGVMRP